MKSNSLNIGKLEGRIEFEGKGHLSLGSVVIQIKWDGKKYKGKSDKYGVISGDFTGTVDKRGYVSLQFPEELTIPGISVQLEKEEYI
jgi:hypothetical protein